MIKLNIAALLAATALASFRPYEGGKAGWKTVKAKIGDAEVDVIEVKDGNPVWLGADGQESTLGGDTIANLNREAKTHREAKEAAEAKLKLHEGIDPVKAREALELVGKIDQKKLIDAGEVDRVKGDIAKTYEERIAATEAAAAAANKRADDTLIDNVFANSKFINEKVAVPRDMLKATFGNRFGVEDGKVVVFDTDGKTKLLSKVKQGEYADFDEGLSVIVNGYAAKDAILKGGNHSGSGNNGGGGGGKPGQARYSREEYNALPPNEQQRIGLEAGQGKAEIYD